MSEFFGFNKQIKVESQSKCYDFEVNYSQLEWDYNNPEGQIVYVENYSQISEKLLKSISENKEFDVEIHLVSYTTFDGSDDIEEIDRVDVVTVGNEIVINQDFLDANKDIPRLVFEVVLDCAGV